MMKKGIARFTAFCMAAGMTLGGSGIVSYATGADVSLVGVSSTTRAAVPAESETEETQTEERRGRGRGDHGSSPDRRDGSSDRGCGRGDGGCGGNRSGCGD